MGRISHPPAIHHGGHPHPLQLAPLPSPVPCAACGIPTAPEARSSYSCRQCGYSLHVSCASLPPSLSHPSHLDHDLCLLFAPAYPEGSFDCDACGARGERFCYHCRTCCVDLHALCALLPSVFLHPSHFHPLALAFRSPYGDEDFACDVCGRAGPAARWLYRCTQGCGFDAHLDCIAVASPGHGARFQQAAGAPRPQKLLAAVRPPERLGVNGHGGRPQPGGYSQYNTTPPRRTSNSFMKKLVKGATQNLVEGMAQQAGQTVVQSILSNDEDAGSGRGIYSSGEDSGNSTFSASTIGEPSEMDMYYSSTTTEVSVSEQENEECTEADLLSEWTVSLEASQRRWRRS